MTKVLGYYILTAWKHEDQQQALSEGWGLFDNSDYGLRIESYENQRFDSDSAAAAFVGYRAALGNDLAKKAFAELAWHYAVSDAAEDSL